MGRGGIKATSWGMGSVGPFVREKWIHVGGGGGGSGTKTISGGWHLQHSVVQ